MTLTRTDPHGWKRNSLELDHSWIHPLTEQEITDLESSLQHVLKLEKK